MKIEEYQKLASLLNEARKILYDDAFPDGHWCRWKKSSPEYKNWEKTTDAIDKARDKGEELMFLDCPEQASVYIFYPGSNIKLNTVPREEKPRD